MPKLDNQQRKHVQDRIRQFMANVRETLKEKHTTKQSELSKAEKQRLLDTNRSYSVQFKRGSKINHTLDQAIDWDDLGDGAEVIDQTAYKKELAKYEKKASQIQDHALLSTSDTDVVKLMEDLQKFCEQEVV